MSRGPAPGPSAHPLRRLAAELILLTGGAQIAALWWRPLDAAGVLDAVLGAAYLIIGLGLYGSSRFSLALAVVAPLGAAAWRLWATDDVGALQLGHSGIEFAIAVCAALALWRSRAPTDH